MQPAFVQNAIHENANDLVDKPTVLKVLGDFKRDTGFKGKTANGSGAGPNGSGERPEADPLERIRLRSATGQPRPSPGARTREQPDTRTGSFEDEWARADQEERRTGGEAHLA